VNRLEWSFFKGIVSRDFLVCFWCHSIDLRFLTDKAQVHLLFVFMSNFSIFAPRRSEFTLVELGLLDFPQLLSQPRTEPITALMQMLVWRNNIEDVHCPSPGLYTTIRSSSVHDQNLAPFCLTASSVIININSTKISCIQYEPRTMTNLCAILLSGAHYAENSKMAANIKKFSKKTKF
jgi:hypothetical protein